MEHDVAETGIREVELLPRFALSIEDDDSGIAQWRDAVAMLFDARPTDRPFRVGLNSYSLGDLLFGAVASVGHRFVRDRAVIARSGIDHLLVQLYLEGGFTGMADNRPCDVRAGDVVLFDLARTFATEVTPFANLSLVVPRRLLPIELRDRNLHGAVLSPATSAGRMLAAHLKTLWSVCENAAVGDAPEIVRATVALVTAIVSELSREAGGDRGHADGAVRGAICRHVEENLAMRSLDAAYLCEHFGVSRSNLYRMFENLGGVATFVRNRRLDAAFDELSAVGRQSGRLDLLAHKLGFSSQDTFARAFRARYGFSPNRMRRGSPAIRTKINDRPVALSTPSDWLRTIGCHASDIHDSGNGNSDRLR